MTHYLKNGNSFRVYDQDEIDVRNQLPVGNYIVKEDDFKNLYLEGIDPFKVSGKIYGDAQRNADRIMRTFQAREASTGVLLTGEKGSGKTMLARMLGIKMQELGNPTIVINTPRSGDNFNEFMQNINQPCMVLFDEFEKVYDGPNQDKLLTLLDGTYTGKKLFVLTCNDKWKIGEHMRNRPGRLYYSIDFSGLDEEFIREYCADTLQEKSHIDRICTLAGLFNEFNFDMLKALVEEMNRYGEPPELAIRLLNAKPENADKSKFTVEVTLNDKAVKTYFKNWEGNPIRDKLEVGYYPIKQKRTVGIVGNDPDDDDDDDREYAYFTFDPSHLVVIDMVMGTFTYKNAEGLKVILTKQKGANKLDYSKLF